MSASPRSFDRNPADLEPTAPSPWYRHRWPWFLIAGPAIVVVAGFVTLWLSIASFDGLVADDYYRQGLGINKTIARAERASALGLVAHVRIDADGLVGMRIEGDGEVSRPARVRVSLLRPAQAGGDLVATLVRVDGDRYAGRMAAPNAGWSQLAIESDEWRLPSIDVHVPFAAVVVRADPRDDEPASPVDASVRAGDERMSAPARR